MTIITPVKLKRMLIDAQEFGRSGWFNGDAAFFLVATPIFKLATQIEELGASPKLISLDKKMVAIEKQYARKPLPQEWHDLEYEWNLTLDKIIIGKFIECGEPGMAALYASDRFEFYRRYENGRRLTFEFGYNK